MPLARPLISAKVKHNGYFQRANPHASLTKHLFLSLCCYFSLTWVDEHPPPLTGFRVSLYLPNPPPSTVSLVFLVHTFLVGFYFLGSTTNSGPQSISCPHEVL